MASGSSRGPKWPRPGTTRVVASGRAAPRRGSDGNHDRLEAEDGAERAGPELLGHEQSGPAGGVTEAEGPLQPQLVRSGEGVIGEAAPVELDPRRGQRVAVAALVERA